MSKRDDSVSEKEFALMVKLSNFFDDPKSPEFFKSRNHIGRVFTGKSNPKMIVRRVVKRMEDMGFVRIASNNLLEFDEEKFDDWFRSKSELGRDVWVYIDRHITYLKIK